MGSIRDKTTKWKVKYPKPGVGTGASPYDEHNFCVVHGWIPKELCVAFPGGMGVCCPVCFVADGFRRRVTQVAMLDRGARERRRVKFWERVEAMDDGRILVV